MSDVIWQNFYDKSREIKDYYRKGDNAANNYANNNINDKIMENSV